MDALTVVGSRAGNYLVSVWQCRWFWLSLATLDVHRKYRRSIVGLGWAFVQPSVMALTLAVIFAGAFGVSVAEHFPSVLVGICFWSLFAQSVQQGCGSIYWSETYIRQHRAPLAIYTLRIALAGYFHFLVALAPAVFILAATKQLPTASACVWLLTLSVALLAMAWALATLFGLANIFFPDTQHFADVGLQLLFYCTPIIYPVRMLHERGLGLLADLNPLAAFVEALRSPLIAGLPPAPWIVGVVLVGSAAACCLAALALSLLERRVVFHL